MNALEIVKRQKWFYEFKFPDGSVTESYLPELARQVHTTREKALRNYLDINKGKFNSSLDISCHEGYFTLVLRDYFDSVTGIDKNAESLSKAKQISKALKHKGLIFKNSSLEQWPNERVADFVLCYGLLYHVENPVQILRKLALLTNKTLCLETQVLPYDMTGKIEDGSYMWQRNLYGLFGLCADYSHSKEGGLTDLAFVPSKNGLEFLLNQFGFEKLSYFMPDAGDYEQFVRGQRVIIYAEK